jgi:hypothetical protein
VKSDNETVGSTGEGQCRFQKGKEEWNEGRPRKEGWPEGRREGCMEGMSQKVWLDGRKEGRTDAKKD